MNKRNTILGAGLVVIVVVVIVFALAHGSNKPSAANKSDTSTTSQSVKPIISTKTSSTLGEYLVNSAGKPLYAYGGDSTGVSNCSGSCTASWPIYGPVSSSASLPSGVTIITRSDGRPQYAYKGMPLYTFVGDSGTTPTGNDEANFHLAKP